MVRVLAAPLADPKPQEGEPVYAAKIRPAELRIDWSQSVDLIDRLVRLGGAWTTFRGRRMKVIEAVADGASSGAAPGLRLVRVQPEGKPVLSYADWVRGARPGPDERFE